MNDRQREGQTDVTVEEAATILGLSRSTVLGLLDNGALPFRRAGDVGQMRIPRDAVSAYRQTMVAERQRALDEIIATSDELGFSDG